jgi:uncharacterized protein (DUF302 family)
VKTHKFESERIEVVSKRSFAETIAVLERKIPAADPATFAQLVNSRATAAQVEETVQTMAGDLGFVTLAKIDQGPLVSLLGKPKKMTVYLIGNPVLANRMFEHHPAVGVYAPLRVAIYEDYAGVTHFTYERPSSLLTQFNNAEIGAIARVLDEKLTVLASHLAE